MDEIPRKCPICEGTDFLRPKRRYGEEHWFVEPEDRPRWKDPVQADVEFEVLICAFCGLTQTFATNLDTLKRVRKIR